MNLEELQRGYEELRHENENLKYHISLLLMMLPERKNYDFFYYSITMNLSEIETAKILKTLMKINSKLKCHDIDSSMYTVGVEAIAFNTEVPLEDYGVQFINCLSEIFDTKRNITPIAVLKACKAQGIYIEACNFLLEQIDKV